MNIELVDTEVSVGGTSLQGYVKTTYDEIVEIFGEPRHTSSGDDKITAEWNLEFDVDDECVIATIYDWKVGETPLGKHRWHIGGHFAFAAEVVNQYMRDASE